MHLYIDSSIYNIVCWDVSDYTKDLLSEVKTDSVNFMLNKSHGGNQNGRSRWQEDLGKRDNVIFMIMMSLNVYIE